MRKVRSTRPAIRARAAAAVLVVLVAGAGGCEGGKEGDRCNALSTDDGCGAGLSCVAPTSCAETVCCPAGPSSAPECQACATAGDGGSDGAPANGGPG